VRLRRLARRLSRTRMSAASVHREVGRYAEAIGVVRPSYQQIRIAVNAARVERAAKRATTRLLFQVDLGVRPVTDLRELLEE
jgi:hypothetical protein